MVYERSIPARMRAHCISLALVLAGVASLVLFSPYTTVSWSEDGSDKWFGAIRFNIPAQPLDSALQAYSKLSGVDVLYESRIASQLYSSPVEGMLTRQAALEAMLAGTDVTVQYTRSDAITLSLASYQVDIPPASPLADADLMLDTLRVSAVAPPDKSKMRDFSQSAQADIEAALRKDTRTNSGNYRASVKLWVDPTRVIRRAELAQSTGDATRDASIADTLRGLMLRKEPPENAPQPVRIVIVVRSL
jgi:hypothetical protein